jgi:hypothetical protein
VDRPLQLGGTVQRIGNALASRVLCGVVCLKQDTTRPQLSGAVQIAITRKIVNRSHMERLLLIRTISTVFLGNRFT